MVTTRPGVAGFLLGSAVTWAQLGVRIFARFALPAVRSSNDFSAGAGASAPRASASGTPRRIAMAIGRFRNAYMKSPTLDGSSSKASGQYRRGLLAGQLRFAVLLAAGELWIQSEGVIERRDAKTRRGGERREQRVKSAIGIARNVFSFLFLISAPWRL